MGGVSDVVERVDLEEGEETEESRTRLQEYVIVIGYARLRH